MVEVILNTVSVQAREYEERLVPDREKALREISFSFQVSSGEYHKIATLLYERIFDIKVPERGVSFRGAIQQYFTSVTNLYEEGQIGTYFLTLMEVR